MVMVSTYMCSSVHAAVHYSTAFVFDSLAMTVEGSKEYLEKVS